MTTDKALKADLAEAKSIIKELLKHCPYPYCAEMHHDKKDYHSYDEPCPVVERAMKVRQQAEDFVTKNNKRKNNGT
jgi:hypothetical protein